MNELQAKLIAARAEVSAIEAEISAVSKAARAGQIAEVRALMQSQGLTASDLGASPAAKAIKTAREPMYRDETGQTWAGRGKRPTWLNTALTAGRTLDSYRIGA